MLDKIIGFVIIFIIIFFGLRFYKWWICKDCKGYKIKSGKVYLDGKFIGTWLKNK